MTRAVLSIGSNLGDRLGHLQSVLDSLGANVSAVSAVYETAPWGGVDQQDFLNAVVVAEDPDRDCGGWLRFGQELEAAADRVREVHWGPRTLDVDVVDCDGIRSSDPVLTLPHPRAHERAFVLVPWLDADPAAELFVGEGSVPVGTLVQKLADVDRAGVRKTTFTLTRKPIE
ncbi:2-amino-4-hydroxy-6-hydroxymethyldihydropteridine diphosphokinase [Antrihabitans sp. YC2-6]|uniref:2-amino-4-hydroxy-6- hydroxymethyldihydropteridine diphosphokinase n=1 Tax=Antrihabitans sp. YC2-6 TaxID=2799498 RepID=UPI0018F338CD|nr:2-amino-4-hydroxy-6-hydroxymethyldihydropteridine diphosphokinase [Antrihabitans sp. YC2-6]MBJ8345973.1 2-amino-4-hydroxy-6-hydroxymethyldihydropteridine diphosphokinase [Antrihabitans sp. YC2-6]